MSGAVLAFPGCSLPAEPAPYGGLTLAVGTWLYHQPPGGYSDAVLVVAVEGNTGPVSYSLSGGMRALPRTRITVRKDGGAGEARVYEHIDDASLRRCVPGNYREHFGYLELVRPDPENRAAFVARCAAEPARREAEARRVEEEKERARREVGPWFADVETAIAGPRAYVADTIEAKVLRRACKEIAGVKVKVGVRRYSMASGLDFGGTFTADEAARINAVFPGIVNERRYRDYDTGDYSVSWEGESGLYPRAHDDRSDLQTDYHQPGGFRVANAYLLDVSRILSEEIAKGGAS